MSFDAARLSGCVSVAVRFLRMPSRPWRVCTKKEREREREIERDGKCGWGMSVMAWGKVLVCTGVPLKRWKYVVRRIANFLGAWHCINVCVGLLGYPQPVCLVCKQDYFGQMWMWKRGKCYWRGLERWKCHSSSVVIHFYHLLFNGCSTGTWR